MYYSKYLQIKFEDTLLIMRHFRNGILRDSRIYDILELKESGKKLISQWLHHYEEIPLITTYEELKYLRKCGIRIW